MCTFPFSIPWFMVNFAQRFRELRTARELTQTRLALDKLVKRSRVSRVMAET